MTLHGDDFYLWHINHAGVLRGNEMGGIYRWGLGNHSLQIDWATYVSASTRILLIFCWISVNHSLFKYSYSLGLGLFAENVHLFLHIWPVCIHSVCSLTFVHVKLYPRTPSRPSRRMDLWRKRSHNRKCTSGRPTSVTGRLQSGNRHRYSAVKQNIYSMNNLLLCMIFNDMILT